MCGKCSGQDKIKILSQGLNPNLEYYKYLSMVTTSWKKINIAKIRMKSHELHSETWLWFIPKTPWEEKVFHVCGSMSVEDENHFLLECLAYTHIRSKFDSICTIQTFITT